jgi:hypothetical protein
MGVQSMVLHCPLTAAAQAEWMGPMLTGLVPHVHQRLVGDWRRLQSGGEAHSSAQAGVAVEIGGVPVTYEVKSLSLHLTLGSSGLASPMEKL